MQINRETGNAWVTTNTCQSHGTDVCNDLKNGLKQEEHNFSHLDPVELSTFLYLI